MRLAAPSARTRACGHARAPLESPNQLLQQLSLEVRRERDNRHRPIVLVGHESLGIVTRQRDGIRPITDIDKRVKRICRDIYQSDFSNV